MSLLRSICCLFAGWCEGEEPKPTRQTMRSAAPGSQGDLGQKEAEMEKSGKEQMSHMEGALQPNPLSVTKGFNGARVVLPPLGPSSESQS